MLELLISKKYKMIFAYHYISSNHAQLGVNLIFSESIGKKQAMGILRFNEWFFTKANNICQ